MPRELTREYLMSVYEQSRGSYLPEFLWDELHNRARAQAGGKAKKRKHDEKGKTDDTEASDPRKATGETEGHSSPEETETSDAGSNTDSTGSEASVGE